MPPRAKRLLAVVPAEVIFPVTVTFSIVEHRTVPATTPTSAVPLADTVKSVSMWRSLTTA